MSILDIRPTREYWKMKQCDCRRKSYFHFKGAHNCKYNTMKTKKEIIHKQRNKTIEKCICRDARVSVSNQDYKAIVIIKEFPQTTQGQEKMSVWLSKVSDQILTANKDDYAKTVRFRMMK